MAVARAMNTENKSVKYLKSVLSKLKALQNFVTEHRVDSIELSRDLMKTTVSAELVRLIDYVSTAVQDAELVNRPVEGQRGKIIPFPANRKPDRTKS